MLIVIAFAITKSVHARSCLIRFCSLVPAHKFYLRLTFLDPTALPPRHGSNVLIRAPLLGVRTASDLCCRDFLNRGFPILVHTLCYSQNSRVVDRAMSVGLRALLRSPCRDHPHAPSIYLVCDRRFLSVAESDVKNCRTSSYLAGRGALGSIARIVSSSSL